MYSIDEFRSQLTEGKLVGDFFKSAGKIFLNIEEE